jgi:hypothetical protein
MNNPAIPMSAARAVSFLAHANEKQGQANGNSNRCASARSLTPIGVEGRVLRPLPKRFLIVELSRSIKCTVTAILGTHIGSGVVLFVAAHIVRRGRGKRAIAIIR